MRTRRRRPTDEEIQAAIDLVVAAYDAVGEPTDAVSAKFRGTALGVVSALGWILGEDPKTPASFVQFLQICRKVALDYNDQLNRRN